MTSKDEATAAGVAEAWVYWIEQHPIGVPELITKAVGNAFDTWLRAHSDDLINAIAEAVARRQVPRPGGGPS